jgi:aminopeptidase YwaD
VLLYKIHSLLHGISLFFINFAKLNLKIKMKIRYLFFLLLIICSKISSQIDIEVPGLSVISKQDLMKTVRFLASKDLAGRLSGSDGYNKAAYYMANEFKMLDLKPAIDKEYFQNFNVEYNEIYSPVKLNLVEDVKNIREFKIGKDFVCRGFTGSGNFTAPIVFCGYGISQPKNGYDDYSGVDAKGKIVICFKYNPDWKINDSTNWDDGSLRHKELAASQHGAIGIFFVSKPNEAIQQKAILSILEGNGKQMEDFPAMHIDIPVADKFLAGTGFHLKDLQTSIDSNKKPFSLNLKTKAEMEIHAKYYKEKPTMNIVGILEGTDEKLKDEYVVIGAHLDHVGSQAGEIFAPGANDNASGSSAVLEIAKAFTEGNVRPKRSVLFVLFASEEIGMSGSNYFVDHSPVPLEKITAMINLDCIGFGDSIQIGNGKSAPKLWRIARVKDSIFTKMMVNKTWSGGGADSGPFHDKGIPCAYFVTTNSYEHLHYITDTPETLNKDLFEKITKLAFLTAVEASSENYSCEVVVK